MSMGSITPVNLIPSRLRQWAFLATGSLAASGALGSEAGEEGLAGAVAWAHGEERNVEQDLVPRWESQTELNLFICCFFQAR